MSYYIKVDLSALIFQKKKWFSKSARAYTSVFRLKNLIIYVKKILPQLFRTLQQAMEDYSLLMQFQIEQ